MNIERYVIPATESTLTIEDVFTVGVGSRSRLVVTGKSDGEIQSGASFKILDGKTKIASGTISQIEQFRKILQKVDSNTPVGLTLTGVTKNQLKRGMKLVVK